MNIYVGNLPYDVTAKEIRLAFSTFGRVNNVALKIDQKTGKSKGYAFIEMPCDNNAKKAINSLNNSDFIGRTITVKEAGPEPEHHYRKRPKKK